MFKPMNTGEFTALVNSIVLTNGGQQQAIQTALLQATFATFSTDYRTAGNNGEADYDAPHFNAIMDLMEAARGVDVDAIARWINTFAPVQFDKPTGYFSVNKQKVDAMALHALDTDAAANAFWQWATSAKYKARVTGASDETLYAPVLNWYELDGATRARAMSAFTAESVDARLISLIKACVKNGMDDAAATLTKVKNDVVAAAKLAEAKHADGVAA